MHTACTRRHAVAHPWSAFVRMALALLLVCPFAVGAHDLSEAQVKAAYIHNFAKFVEWPAEAFAAAQAPLVLCVAGKDGLGGALAAIEGKPVQGRDLRIKRAVGTDEVRTCHMLFVSEGDEKSVGEVLRAVGALPVLTIGDVDGFAAAGGAIGFVPRDDRVLFEINPDAAKRANLKISSQLLRLAIIVQYGRRFRL